MAAAQLPVRRPWPRPTEQGRGFGRRLVVAAIGALIAVVATEVTLATVFGPVARRLPSGQPVRQDYERIECLPWRSSSTKALKE